MSFHSLFGDINGNFSLIEPGYGFKKTNDNYAVITNFPLLTKLEDYSNPFYGSDRYELVQTVLLKANADFLMSMA